MLNKKEQRLRRAKQTRVRISIQRTPRLSVFRTNVHLYATIFSDDGSRVIATASTLQADVKAVVGTKTADIAAAAAVGRMIAARAHAAGVSVVAFDRAGFAYHGRVKALADAAREAGLVF
jgi:large subunit ribosomal protein L18